jgi:hypothetical protein
VQGPVRPLRLLGQERPCEIRRVGDIVPTLALHGHDCRSAQIVAQYTNILNHVENARKRRLELGGLQEQHQERFITDVVVAIVADDATRPLGEHIGQAVADVGVRVVEELGFNRTTMVGIRRALCGRTFSSPAAGKSITDRNNRRSGKVQVRWRSGAATVRLSTLLLAQHQIHYPTPVGMWAGIATVVEDLGAVASCVLKGIRQNRQR